MELISTMTSKGQVTIPKEVRKRLGLQPREKVAFVVDDDMVVLKRLGSVVERTAGAFKVHGGPLSAEELREAAEEAMATEAWERGRR